MLLRQTLLYLPAQVVGPLFVFIAIIAWTHLLSPAEMGIFALVTATQELAHVVCLAWFSYWSLRYLGPFENDDARQAYLNTEAPIMAVSVVTSFLIAAALVIYLGRGAADPWLMFVAGLQMASRTVTTHLVDRARVQHDTLSFSVLQVAGPCLGLLLGILATKWLAASATVALGGYAVAQIVALLVVIPRIGIGRIFAGIDRDIFRSALAYGAPFIVSGPLIWGSLNGVRYVVELAEGAIAVGLITVGWGLGQRGATVASMIPTAAAFPLAARRAREDGLEAGADQLARNGVLLLLVLLPAMAGLCILNASIAQVLVAEPYRAATIAIVPWAALAGGTRSIRFHFTNPIFNLAERSPVAVAIDGIDLVATLLLAALGQLAGGMMGAVIGATAGAVIGLLASFYWGVRHYNLVVLWGDLGRIAAASLAMTAVLAFVPVATTIVGLGCEIALGAAVYTIVLLLTYPRAKEEAGHLMGRLRQSRSGVQN